MMNNVSVSGFARNFELKSLKRMDFDMELKGRKNGFLRETDNFENMNDFRLK